MFWILNMHIEATFSLANSIMGCGVSKHWNQATFLLG
jgi:hypothetical protein